MSNYGKTTIHGGSADFAAIQSPPLVQTAIAKLSPATLAECRRVAEAARLGLSLADYDAYIQDQEREARALADLFAEMQTEARAWPQRPNRHDD